MLEKAVSYAKARDQDAARALLRQVVAEDPYNEHAWGWLAACAETATERRQALERVLEINPANQAARRALEKLSQPTSPEQPSLEQQESHPEESEEQPTFNAYLRRFWNWSTTTRRKAVIVFSLIIVFACCCPLAGIGTLLVGEEPTPTSARVIGLATNTPPPTMTIAPTEMQLSTKTQSPTQTPTPTKPTRSSTSTPAIESIVDTGSIMGFSVQEVEGKLGVPTKTVKFGVGDLPHVPGGGEFRTYVVGKYKIDVDYDRTGIVKGLQVVEGLAEDEYTLDQWPTILSRIGVDFAGSPDVEAPAAVRWTNASGYEIMIAAHGIGRYVWTVGIFKIP
jgi:hypothetical protein